MQTCIKGWGLFASCFLSLEGGSSQAFTSSHTEQKFFQLVLRLKKKKERKTILTIAAGHRLFLRLSRGANPSCHSGLWLPHLPATILGLFPHSCFLGFSPHYAEGAAGMGDLCIFSGMSLPLQLPVVKPTGAADAPACAGTECTKSPLLKDLALCTLVADVRGWKRSCFLRKSLFFMCIRDREAKKCVLLNLS